MADNWQIRDGEGGAPPPKGVGVWVARLKTENEFCSRKNCFGDAARE